jgi:5'-nucleotidase
MSQYFGIENRALDDPFEAALEHGASTVNALLAHGGWDDADYQLFYNVNFPPVAAANVLGTKAVSQGFRRGTNFTVEAQQSPTGRQFIWVKGGDQTIQTQPGSDVHANLNGYTSVTPMRADLTDLKTLSALQGHLN